MFVPTDLRTLLGLCLSLCLGYSPLQADCSRDLYYLSECLASEDQPFLERAHYRYTISGKREMLEMLEAFPHYYPILLDAVRHEGLPDWLAYLPLAESRLAVNARSRAGAAGLWQLMPFTARSLGLKVGRKTDERLDVYKSSRAAARYLRLLHDQFDDWLLALAAYNCGSGNVRKAQRKSGGYFYHEISPYLPSQTRRYLPRVITSTKIANAPSQYGFDLSKEAKVDWVLIEIPETIKMEWVAAYYKVPIEKLLQENPAYKDEIIRVHDVSAAIKISQSRFLNPAKGPWKAAICSHHWQRTLINKRSYFAISWCLPQKLRSPTSSSLSDKRLPA